MKALATILILAALGGCSTMREFGSAVVGGVMAPSAGPMTHGGVMAPSAGPMTHGDHRSYHQRQQILNHGAGGCTPNFSTGGCL